MLDTNGRFDLVAVLPSGSRGTTESDFAQFHELIFSDSRGMLIERTG
jgi:hypothetical protein